MQNSTFYKELLNVSISEGKDTNIQVHSEEKNYPAPIEIYSEENAEEWSDANREMIRKIISLCGFSLDETKVHNFTNTAQLASAFGKNNTKYILLFCDTPIIKTLNFSLKKIGFTLVGDTMIYYNPKVSDLANNKDAKMRLWNAMKKEFSL